jgi:hypothetical protein
MPRPLGELSQALLLAAAASPGTVRELAARSQVGFAQARYTASRLVSRGALVEVDATRPAVLAPAETVDSSHGINSLAVVLGSWGRSG